MRSFLLVLNFSFVVFSGEACFDFPGTLAGQLRLDGAPSLGQL